MIIVLTHKDKIFGGYAPYLLIKQIVDGFQIILNNHFYFQSVKIKNSI
jgi:hypothetical protein